MRAFVVGFRIVVLSAAAAALAYFGAGFIPPVYRSYESLYFPAMNGSGGYSAIAALQGKTSESDTMVVPSLNGALSSPLVGSGPQTAIGILTSNETLLAVIDHFKLERKWRLNKMRAIRRLRDSLNIVVDKTGFLRIEVSLESPKLCIDVINKLHELLIQKSDALTLNLSKSNREFIEQRLAKAEEEVQSTSRDLSEKLKSSPFADLDSAGKLYVDVKVKLAEARVKESSAERQLGSIESSLRDMLAESTGFAGILTALQALGFSAQYEAVNKTLTNITTELQQRRLALDDISKKFTRESPEYKNAEKAVKAAEELSKQIIAKSSQDVKSALPQLTQAKAELAALKATVSSYESMLTEYDAQRQTATDAFAAAQDSRSKYETALATRKMLTEELEMARIAEERDPSRFEIVDPPMIDPDPISPRKLLIAGSVFAIIAALQLWPFALRRPKAQPTTS